MAEAQATEQQDEQTGEGVEVQDAELNEVIDTGAKSAGGQIGVILDSAIAITASMGKVEIPVREILELTTGSVVKLDRRQGEPIDLLLRGVKFATGRLVVVGEYLGVRIEQIEDPEPVEEGDV